MAVDVLFKTKVFADIVEKKEATYNIELENATDSLIH